MEYTEYKNTEEQTTSISIRTMKTPFISDAVLPLKVLFMSDDLSSLRESSKTVCVSFDFFDFFLLILMYRKSDLYGINVLAFILIIYISDGFGKGKG